MILADTDVSKQSIFTWS